MAYWNCGKVPCSRESVRTKPEIRAVPSSNFLWEVMRSTKSQETGKGEKREERNRKKKGNKNHPWQQVSPTVRTDISSYSGWAPHCNLRSHVFFFPFFVPHTDMVKTFYFLFFVKFNIFLILHSEFRSHKGLGLYYPLITWITLNNARPCYVLHCIIVRYELNHFFPSFMEYLTPRLIDFARLPTRNVIWELATATQLTLWYPTYISTGDLCLNTKSLPFFRRRKVGFEVPALQKDNQQGFITKFSLNDLDFYNECPL